MVRDHPTVIVFEVVHPSLQLETVTPKAFRSHRRHLKVYDRPNVLCSFYEAMLGVFSQDAEVLSDAEEAQLAASIEAVDERHITCARWSAALGAT